LLSRHTIRACYTQLIHIALTLNPIYRSIRVNPTIKRSVYLGIYIYIHTALSLSHSLPRPFSPSLAHDLSLSLSLSLPPSLSLSIYIYIYIYTYIYIYIYMYIYIYIYVHTRAARCASPCTTCSPGTASAPVTNHEYISGQQVTRYIYYICLSIYLYLYLYLQPSFFLSLVPSLARTHALSLALSTPPSYSLYTDI